MEFQKSDFIHEIVFVGVDEILPLKHRFQTISNKIIQWKEVELENSDDRIDNLRKALRLTKDTENSKLEEQLVKLSSFIENTFDKLNRQTLFQVVRRHEEWVETRLLDLKKIENHITRSTLYS